MTERDFERSLQDDLHDLVDEAASLRSGQIARFLTLFPVMPGRSWWPGQSARTWHLPKLAIAPALVLSRSLDQLLPANGRWRTADHPPSPHRRAPRNPRRVEAARC